jgi:hypothetical protein
MIEKLNNTEGVAKSQSTAGQRELLREYRNKTNEIIDAVNALEATVYAAPDDDICDDCAFDALLDELQDLDDEQLMVVSAEANRLREERSQGEMMSDDDEDDLRDMDDLTNGTDDEEEGNAGAGQVRQACKCHMRG